MTQPVGGVVRNGVVVPDVPLPEGQRVEIVMVGQLEFTPEEREEFEAWDRASAKAMEWIERLERGELADGAR